MNESSFEIFILHIAMYKVHILPINTIYKYMYHYCTSYKCMSLLVSLESGLKKACIGSS